VLMHENISTFFVVHLWQIFCFFKQVCWTA
jgi:hypothetical protein